MIQFYNISEEILLKPLAPMNELGSVKLSAIDFVPHGNR